MAPGKTGLARENQVWLWDMVQIYSTLTRDRTGCFGPSRVVFLPGPWAGQSRGTVTPPLKCPLEEVHLCDAAFMY